MFRRLSESTQQTVSITVNGQQIKAQQGDTVAAAVLASGMRTTRTSPVSGAARAPFCAMGVCFDCLMVIDGKPNQRACMTVVSEGMRVEQQHGAGERDEHA